MFFVAQLFVFVFIYLVLIRVFPSFAFIYLGVHILFYFIILYFFCLSTQGRGEVPRAMRLQCDCRRTGLSAFFL